MTYVGEEKVFLDPLKVPGWVWKWNWWRQMNRRKAYQFYGILISTRQPSQENDDHKKWPEEEDFRPFRQRNSVFAKTWWDRKIWPKGMKWWRSNEEGVTVGLTRFGCTYFLAPKPPSLVSGDKNVFFPPGTGRVLVTWKSYVLLSGKKDEVLGGQSDLASPVFSDSFSLRFWICQGDILRYCVLKPNTYSKCEVAYLKK